MVYTIAKIGDLSIQPDFEMFLIISIPDIQSQFHLIREKITKKHITKWFPIKSKEGKFSYFIRWFCG